MILQVLTVLALLAGIVGGFGPIVVRAARWFRQSFGGEDQSETDRYIANLEATPLRIRDLNETALTALKEIVNRVRQDWIDPEISKVDALPGFPVPEIEPQFDLVPQPPMGPRVPSAGFSTIRARTIFSRQIGDTNPSHLLLGEPGSGKSLALVSNAERLIHAFNAGRQSPVPVFLTLASWHSRRNFLEWLVERIRAHYNVQEEIAAYLLRRKRLVLILDGLDEVPGPDLDDAIRAINEFLEKCPPAGIIVSCRSEEYRNHLGAGGDKLRLDFAVSLRRLNPAEVGRFLNLHNLTAIGAHFENDEHLQEIIRTPLILSTVVQGFRNADTQTLDELASRKDAASIRSFVFRTYLDHLLDEHSDSVRRSRFSRSSVYDWLAWLATCMCRAEAHAFSLRGIQPSWLPKGAPRRFYFFWSRVAVGLMFGSIGGSVLGLMYFPQTGMNVGIAQPINSSLLPIGLVIGSSTGLLAGLVAAVLDSTRLEKGIRHPVKVWAYLRRFLLLAFPVGLLTGVLFWLLVVPRLEMFVTAEFFQFLTEKEVRFGRSIFLAAPISIGVLWGMLLWALFGIRAVQQPPDEDIQLGNEMGWSWRKARSGFVGGALWGLGVASSFGLLDRLLGGFPVASFGIFPETQFEAFVGTLLFMAHNTLYWAVLAATFFGLVKRPRRSGPRPNPLTIRSGRFSLTSPLAMSVFFLLFLTVADAAICIIFSELRFRILGGGDVITFGRALPISFIWSTGLAILVYLWFGGWDVIRHAIIRIQIRLAKPGARTFTRFLNLAARMGVLRIRGGEYQFFHGLLRDHYSEDSQAREVL